MLTNVQLFGDTTNTCMDDKNALKDGWNTISFVICCNCFSTQLKN
jgi:hypothetical protein